MSFCSSCTYKISLKKTFIGSQWWECFDYISKNYYTFLNFLSIFNSKFVFRRTHIYNGSFGSNKCAMSKKPKNYHDKFLMGLLRILAVQYSCYFSRFCMDAVSIYSSSELLLQCTYFSCTPWECVGVHKVKFSLSFV